MDSDFFIRKRNRHTKMQVVDNFRLMQIKSGGKIVVLHEFTKLLAASSATQIKNLLRGSVFLAARQ